MTSGLFGSVEAAPGIQSGAAAASPSSPSRVPPAAIQSESATDAEVRKKEVEFIRLLRSNDPTIGYNRWPVLRGELSPSSSGGVS